MASTILFSIFGGLLKLALLAGLAFYASIVLVNYRADGLPARPPIDLHDPLNSSKRWAIWLGVRVLDLLVRAAKPFFGMLSEASADVGEWFLERRHHESH